jgi:HAD superfamily hydrolase (TIGR01490 family)
MRAKTAAFYDLDGTLLRGNISDHYLYYAKTDPYLSGRIRRLLEMGLKAPYFWALDRIDRRMFNEVFYKSYAGLSQDRLAVMGEELWERVLSKNLYPGARDLIEGERRQGRKLVLLSGALDFVAKPIGKALGFDHVVASRLEYEKNGLATGELLPPVMAGPEKAQYVRAFCREHDLDIEQCVAYADDAADLPMLSTVGHPVAVNPDIRLATTARSHHWPVIRLDAGMSRLDKARNLLGTVADTARELVDQARTEGESRWEKTEDLGQRVKGMASWLTGIAREAKQAADTAREKNASREESKKS